MLNFTLSILEFVLLKNISIHLALLELIEKPIGQLYEGQQKTDLVKQLRKN
jgi:hypothetical protein